MDKEKLRKILDAHIKWCIDAGGERADLSGADLSDANLDRAYLREADLHDANLRGAKLSNADLWAADLHDAALATALADAAAAGVRGRDVTPFLLERMRQLTGDASLRANEALLVHNARAAAQIAVALQGDINV
jgi:uncharacterized protein YjbI with pentapeptide repeats